MKTPDGEGGTVPQNQPVKRSAAADLLNSEIFGMWADRTDIDDSSEFARDLRNRAWRTGCLREEENP